LALITELDFKAF
jgi:hypothetical protein